MGRVCVLQNLPPENSSAVKRDSRVSNQHSIGAHVTHYGDTTRDERGGGIVEGIQNLSQTKYIRSKFVLWAWSMC